MDPARSQQFRDDCARLMQKRREQELPPALRKLPPEKFKT